MSWHQPRESLWPRLARNVEGGLTTLATLALPAMIGSAGLAFDLNRGYEQRIVNQRVADMAALAAALAYSADSNAAVLTPTARDMAIANGVADAVVEAVLVNDYPASGTRSIRVTITEEVPFTLASVLGLSGNFDVSATAFASLQSGGPDFTPPCYLALFGGADAIKVQGGGTIVSPACSIAANGSVNNAGSLIRGAEIISGGSDILLDWGSLDADKLRYAGILSKPDWNNNLPAPDHRVNQATTLMDPWAADTARVAGMSQIGTYTAPAALTNPTTAGGADWDFNWSPASNIAAYRKGSSANYVVPAGVYDIGRLTTAGGINVTFENGSVIRIANGVANGGGSTINFGNADVYINGGFNSGSSGVTFGDGVLWIGSGTISFAGTSTKGSGDVIINSTLSLGGGTSVTMGAGKHRFGGISIAGGSKMLLGAGDFQASNGVLVDGGGSELEIGNGNVVIGRDGSGNAIRLAGSSKFFMGNGTFSGNGNIDTQGGSRLVFGKTVNHYINGNMTIRGSVLFGSGRYTVNGEFINGTGGTTWPYTSGLTGKIYGDVLEGVSVSGYDMAGIDVTFLLAGTLNLAGGAKTRLEAATTSVTGGVISELLISSATTAATTWTGGASSAFAGAIHVPNSNVTMAGGNSTVSGTKCLSLIARTILVSGGAATGSACTKMAEASGGGSGSTAQLRLVR